MIGCIVTFLGDAHRISPAQVNSAWGNVITERTVIEFCQFVDTISHLNMTLQHQIPNFAKHAIEAKMKMQSMSTSSALGNSVQKARQAARVLLKALAQSAWNLDRKSLQALTIPCSGASTQFEEKLAQLWNWSIQPMNAPSFLSNETVLGMFAREELENCCHSMSFVPDHAIKKALTTILHSIVSTNGLVARRQDTRPITAKVDQALDVLSQLHLHDPHAFFYRLTEFLLFHESMDGALYLLSKLLLKPKMAWAANKILLNSLIRLGVHKTLAAVESIQDESKRSTVLMHTTMLLSALNDFDSAATVASKISDENSRLKALLYLNKCKTRAETQPLTSLSKDDQSPHKSNLTLEAFQKFSQIYQDEEIRDTPVSPDSPYLDEVSVRICAGDTHALEITSETPSTAIVSICLALQTRGLTQQATEIIRSHLLERHDIQQDDILPETLLLLEQEDLLFDARMIRRRKFDHTSFAERLVTFFLEKADMRNVVRARTAIATANQNYSSSSSTDMDTNVLLQQAEKHYFRQLHQLDQMPGSRFGGRASQIRKSQHHAKHHFQKDKTLLKTDFIMTQ
jgi:hypothetical protein